MIGSGSAPRHRLVAATAALIGFGVGACENPQPPGACGPVPQVTVNAGEQATVIACFNDPNGDMLTHSVSSSNPSVASATIAGATVTVRALAPGNASVTVTASDPGGLQGQQGFQVVVPNRPPVPRGTISSVTVHVGRTESVDVSPYFAEPDGQALSYGATSSNPQVAAVSVVGSMVSVTALAKGTTTVHVAATDPGGLVATQTFRSRVPNRSPEPVDAIPDETVEVGEPITVDLSSYFADPDGDPLAYTARSSNTSVARVSVSGSVVSITAIAKGTTNVTITATDSEGLSATQAFRSRVPNRSPEPVDTIPDETVEVGKPITVDLSSYFDDPDGDPLAYTARSSNRSVARVSVSGSVVRITAIARGTTNVTITATDSEGLSATQVFASVVPNRSPEPVGTIADETVEVGEAVTVDLSSYFADPDGDPLAYTARSSNRSVARVSVSGSIVRITAVAKGTAKVTTTATDTDGLSATQAFASVIPNRPPESVGTIPDETVEVGEAVTVDLSSYFEDPDGDPLAHAAGSSNASVAKVSVSGAIATITAVAKGTANVTITATDTEGLSATQAFASVVPNRSPDPAGTIPDETVKVGGTVSVDLLSYFEDPDGDPLTYTAGSSKPSVARVSVSGGILNVTAVARGTTDVTVTATDSDGLAASQIFEVTVPNRPPTPLGAIPEQTIETGGKVAINAAQYFSDPDGDALGYTATSSSTSVATVSVSGSIVTIKAVAAGSATLTITARDPDGLTGIQRASVAVEQANRAPQPVGAIPARTLNPGGTVAINAAQYFTDPDGDALAFTAASSSTSVAGVLVSGSTVTITGVATGNATITITAWDPDGLTADQRADVTVDQVNRAPRPVGAIPAQTLKPGGTRPIDASQYFADPDGDALAYTATSSRTSVATVSVSGSTVTIRGVATGSATITITARDPGGLTATQRARVSVEQTNRAPRPVGTIPTQTLSPGGTRSIDASQYFTDPDGDALTYTGRSSNTSVATVSLSGSTVTIAAAATGSATITVTARDPGALTATQTFRATVEDRGSFDIDLVFATEVSPAQEAAFRDAAKLWMAILADTELPDHQTGGTIACGGEYQQSVATIDDLMIVAAVVEIDGSGGTLGRAGPCWIRNESLLPVFGRMEFDEADLEREEREGRLKSLILHEMGHVLGIGTLWGFHDLLRKPSSQTENLDTHFVGHRSVRAFDAAGGDGYTGGEKVPVENTGGQGTRNSHWRRSVFGNELMIGWLTNSSPLSAITIQSLADLGYTVDPGLANAYRLPEASMAASTLENAIDLGNDILMGPIVVVDRNGRIVRVVPP